MRFALTGAAGFVAPRHLRAISDVAGQLVGALDPHDSVGILDRYNREARFFTEPERFDRFLWKSRGTIDIVSICSPNHLHDAHCRMALRSGANAICEKPLTLRPWNVDQLVELEHETEHRIFVVLQMRFHAAFAGLRDALRAQHGNHARIRYVTPRGSWYGASWKGDLEKSGGICMNVGIHLFDMATWLFGDAVDVEVEHLSATRGAGLVRCERGTFDWFLSIDASDLPDGHTGSLRIFTVNNIAIDASSGFDSLHTELYKAVLSGTAPRAVDARAGVDLVHSINKTGGLL